MEKLLRALQKRAGSCIERKFLDAVLASAVDAKNLLAGSGRLGHNHC